MSKRFNIVTLCDWHVPFHDEKAIETAFDFCEIIQPQIIIIHEAHDFYALSKFDKDPERLNRLQEEIDKVNFYFYYLRRKCPKARIILLNSNHLDRLRKYLWSKAPALSSLRSLQIENLLNLEKNNIEFMQTFTYQNFLFKHGELVRKESGMTAKAEFEKEGMSGCSGHTHRLGTYYKTLRGGEYKWIESGCLCDLKPEYIEGTANWQQGISLVSFVDKNSNHFNATDIPIVNYQINYGGINIK